ncbi:MAG: SRPBCC domain-containing protein [archaeon]
MKKLKIKRIIDAPIDKVWQAFTTQQMLSKWWSPIGMTSSHITVDLREGGNFKFCFEGREGEFWGRGEYRELKKPTKLSYYDTFSDKEGNPVPPSFYGMPGDNIEKLLVEIILRKQGEKTIMVFSGDNPYDKKMTADMTKGWNSMFDKLDSVL